MLGGSAAERNGVVGAASWRYPELEGRRRRDDDSRSQAEATERLRPLRLPSPPGGGVPARRGRRRRPGRHADRRREIALLPASGPAAGWTDPRLLTPHRPDGGPDGEAPRAGPARRTNPLGPSSERVPAGLQALPRRRTGLPVHRPRAPRRTRLHRVPRTLSTGPDRGRRGPLHFAVGPRLPARLPAPGGTFARASAAVRGRGSLDPRSRPDRDRDAPDPGGRREPARPGAGRAPHSRVPARATLRSRW